MENEIREFTAVTIKPLDQGERFQLRLLPPENDASKPIVFELPAAGLGNLLSVLQDFQAKFDIPMPRKRLPKGAPKLQVVNTN